MKRPVASSKSSARFIFFVEGEVKGVERAAGVTEAGLHATPFEEPILSALQFIGDEDRDQVEGWETLGLRVPEAGVQRIGHP